MACRLRRGLANLLHARIFRHRMAVVGLLMVGVVVVGAAFAPLLSPYRPSAMSRDRLQPPSAKHILGTDSYGRDVFSRVLYGARESLILGALALLIGATIGATLGIVAGYFGGPIDIVLSRLMDMMLSFPSIMVALFVLAVFGTAGRMPLVIAIGLSLVPRFARVARGATLPIRSQDYIVAARSLGAGDWAIIVRHVLRNLVGPLTVLCSIYLPTVILIEASLSFLGIGPPPNLPTWGRIIADGRPYLRNAVWISVAPGIAIMLTVMGFNLVGDGLRDLLDPKTSKSIRRT